jgi:hypothetical protein
VGVDVSNGARESSSETCMGGIEADDVEAEREVDAAGVKGVAEVLTVRP